MRSAAFLLLMICSSVSRCRSEGSEPTRSGVGADELAVLWDELRGLKDLVLSLRGEGVGQRQALRSVESRLRDGETMAERQRQNLDRLQVDVHDLRTVLSELSSGSRRTEELEAQRQAQSVQMSELQSRMNSSERSVENLKKKNSVLAAELPFLQTRLRASENTVEQLRRKNAVLAARLCNTESLLEDLREQISEFQPSNRSSEMMPDGGALHKLKANVETGNLVSVAIGLEESRRQLEELKTHNTELLIRLRTSEEHLNQLNTNSTDVEVRLRSTETHLDQIQNQTAALEVRLRVREEQLEEQETENSVCESKLSAVTERLNQTQEQLEVLRTQSSVGAAELVSVSDRLAAAHRNTEVQLCSMESRLTDGLNRTADVEVRLRSTETHLDQIQNQTAALEVRLGVREDQLDELRTESVCESKLSAVTERLNQTQEQLEVLRTQSSVGAAELVSVSDRLAAAHRNTEELQVRLRASEAEMMKLKLENGGGLKVGFSAGLTNSGLVGPFDEETTLIFSKTITNIGQSYNQSAGVFTAPVRGLYFFSFTAADYLKGYMGLHLYRNDQPVVFNLNLNDHGGYATTSNAVLLQLDQGDQVRLGLPASYRLYDDSRNFSVFSGFLLFPL